MNEYQKLKGKLFSLFSNKIKCRLENISDVSNHLNNPHIDFKSLHVAGTNGKGSVATKIAKALSLSGYKTALYTSPHITAYEERISVDGKLISKKDVKVLLKKIFKLQKKLKVYLSFFEITTLLAFLYFSKKKVDFAVIETGLGGRLDATNIITPILSIITSISLDHTNILGDTIDLIAFEKAGIIKPKIPVVIGRKANIEPIIKKAKKSKSKLYLSKELKKHTFYDDENTSIALRALEVFSLKYPLKKSAIKKALKIRPEARFEIFKTLGPKAIIFDVAHNLDGFKELKKAIKLFFPNEKIRVILGFSKQKDALSCLTLLKTFSNFIHVTEAKSFKSLPKAEIEKDLLKINFKKYKIEKNINKAIIDAKNLAIKNNEILLICGSFYILDEIKNYLKIK
ncbi:MAG: Folylpolyglutamate synthase [Candidatus Anoxychlamydiales bacterium]|nr:Folylpolyglutamate synthase [Candidatus Anoxychlamydiales bacterium]HEU64808.1 bifunctional folylpolyglutamate synthase/dihydrofolate synthase [Chlamydiota bacterium]